VATVSWTGIESPTGGDWIALFPQGADETSHVGYRLTEGASSGSS
jgi:hypothetical protein